MTDTRRFHDKFTVTRNDGRDAPGEKHHNCTYFVLDLRHDPFAIPAIQAYIFACREERPDLAVDLMRMLAAHIDCGGSNSHGEQWALEREARSIMEETGEQENK